MFYWFGVPFFHIEDVRRHGAEVERRLKEHFGELSPERQEFDRVIQRIMEKWDRFGKGLEEPEES